MTTTLATRYLTVAQDRLGLDAHIDDNDNVIIRRHGLTFVAFLDADHDPEYLQLLLPLPRPERDLPVADMLAILNGLNRRLKVSCFSLTDDGGILISAEMLIAGPDCLPTPEHLAEVLPRTLSILTSAAYTFVTDLAVHDIEATLSD